MASRPALSAPAGWRLSGWSRTALFLLLAAVSAVSSAHREKTLFTTIQYNSRTSMLEVIHRTYAHDVEHTLGNRLRARGGLDALEARAMVSLELCDDFELIDVQSEMPLALEIVGAELDGEFFYIYQEVALPAMPEALRVRHMMLRDYWPDMSNFVNVHYDEGVASLLFSGNAGTRQVGVDQVDTRPSP